MFKSLLISTLLFTLYGCATPTPQPVESTTLLSFTDLAAEITVHYEATEADDVDADVSESVAAVQQDSPKDTTD